jgi:predicted RNA-binding protein YlqC (UPF0109 family)
MPLELVTFVVQNLVEDPGALTVQTERSGKGLRIEIRCAPGDAGRIIGRNGRIINAIRTLARAAADGRQRVDVHLID